MKIAKTTVEYIRTCERCGIRSSILILGVASLGNTGFGLTNAFHLRMRIALTWGMVAAR